MNLFNRFLAVFGLMTIKRARRLTARLHVYYVGAVVNGVQKEFGCPPVPDHFSRAFKWWETEFDVLVSNGVDDVIIKNDPKFSETNIPCQTLRVSA